MATSPPIMAPAPRPVIRDAHRALAPTPSARRPRVVITRLNLAARHGGQRAGDVGAACDSHDVSHTWGRPARQPGAGWAVVDVETSGFRPGHARIISLAAL